MMKIQSRYMGFRTQLALQIPFIFNEPRQLFFSIGIVSLYLKLFILSIPSLLMSAIQLVVSRSHKVCMPYNNNLLL